ncbi:MAG TPA: cyclopropane-fatty-acyl-phospholipid synthase family protein [Pseudomonadales bacterium]
MKSSVSSTAMAPTTRDTTLIENLVIRFFAYKFEKAGVNAIQIEYKGSVIRAGVKNTAYPVPQVKVIRLKALLSGLHGGMVGLSEAYVAGDWDTSDLDLVTDWALKNRSSIKMALKGNMVFKGLSKLHHRLNQNTRAGSKKNIAFHYDLGNDFYRLWLDRTMSYSSALFSDENESLEAAQQNKYRRIIELLDPQAKQKVLEIGCGWGGFAETLLTEHDVTLDAITLSEKQLAWAKNRMAEIPNEKLNFSLTDYRDLSDKEHAYDRIASIEMLEAVGEAYWPTYFSTLKKCLKPGGIAVIQVITIDDEIFPEYRRTPDFIQRYIFPGGMLPSPMVMREQIGKAGLSLSEEQSFGLDYAKTLQYWAKNFEQAWPEIAAQGFNQRFKRLWRYYLAYCQSGFKAGTIDVRFYRIINE